jgi:Putative Flp pilus-assembly TadE/G-like
MLSGRRSVRHEAGQVVVFFALLIPVIFGLAAIVMDVGNWFVHKRHLQTQVDAAVLAAAPHFVGCFHDPIAANLAISSRALGYAGDTLRPGTLLAGSPPTTTNLQLQEPGDVRVVLNANRYWQPSDGMVPGTNGYGLDNTLDSSDPDSLADPCNERYVDAKATDEDAPPLWGLIPFTPSPKAHAKVQAFDIESAFGMLPWAVPEIDPARVAALFVNEDTGAIVQKQLLDPGGPTAAYSMWQTAPSQPSVVFGPGTENVGVVILVSKNDANPLDGVPNTLAGYCNQDPGLVACWSQPLSATSGLSFIHVYNGGGDGNYASPVIRQVELTNSTCQASPDVYFSLGEDATCSAFIQATIDFGLPDGTDPHPTPPASGFPHCIEVTASPGGPLTWNGTTTGEGSVFTGTVTLPDNTPGGREVVDISWQARDPSKANCSSPNSGTFDKVAAPYISNAGSGPVQYLDLAASQTGTGIPAPDANSVDRTGGGSGWDYVVTVGLPRPLQVLPYTDGPLLLRMASPSGSQNRAFDCDKNVNFEDEISNGCQTRYIENFRNHDNNPLTPKQWNNLLCAGWSTTNLPPPTFDGPAPYPSDCVMTETGDKTGQLRQGLHNRFETPACAPNYWPTTPGEASAFFGPNGSVYDDDPRYVILIITDDTAFVGSGSDPLPIKYFAGFYVTGWDVGGATSGCPDPDGGGPLRGNEPHPIYGMPGTYPQSRDNGDVWGHFVDIFVPSGGADPNLDPCDFGGAPEACVAILVE